MEKQDKESNLDQTEEIIVENQQNPAMSKDEPKIDYAAEIYGLQEKIDQLQDKLLRQLAETENTRTRYSKLIEEEKDYAINNTDLDSIHWCWNCKYSDCEIH